MCRLTAVISSGDPILLADIITRPRMSVIKQSFNCQERLRHDPSMISSPYQQSFLNGDGYGVGWYLPQALESSTARDADCPCVFTSLKPAWADRNLEMIAEKTLSPLIFAHVRAAGPGSGVSTELSCHPFVYGRFLFMHNGCIGEFQRVRRALLGLLNDEAFEWTVSNSCIDSAVIFGLFISRLDRGGRGAYSASELRDKLQWTMATVVAVCEQHNVQETSLLNVVISDGRTLLATRYVRPPTSHLPHASPSHTAQDHHDHQPPPSNSTAASDEEEEEERIVAAEEGGQAASLYFATGTGWAPTHAGSDMYEMCHKDRRIEVAIITSEPLTLYPEEWVPVPSNHLVVCDGSSGTPLADRPPPLPPSPAVLPIWSANHPFPIPRPIPKTIDVLITPMPSCCSRHISKAVMGPPSRLVEVERGTEVDTEWLEQASPKRPVLGTNRSLGRAMTPPPSLSCGAMSLSMELSSPAGIKWVLQSLTPFHRHSFRAHGDAILCMLTIPSAYLPSDAAAVAGSDIVVSGCQDGSIKIWETHTYETIHTLAGHKKAVLSLALHHQPQPRPTDGGSPTNSTSKGKLWLLSGSSDTTVCLWDISCLLVSSTAAVSDGDASPHATLVDSMDHLFPSPDGIPTVLKTTSRLTAVALPAAPAPAPSCHRPSLRTQVRFMPLQGDVLSLCTAPAEGRLSRRHSPAAAAAAEATRQPSSSAHPYLDLYVGFQNTTCVTLSLNELLAPQQTTQRSDGGDAAYHSLAVEPLTGASRHTGFIQAIVGCGEYVLTGGGDGIILVWKGGRMEGALKGHRGGILCLASSDQHRRDGNQATGGASGWRRPLGGGNHERIVFSGSRDKTVRMWDVELRCCRQSLIGHTSEVLSIALTHCYVLSSANSELFIWCRETHRLLSTVGTTNALPMGTAIITATIALPHTSAADEDAPPVGSKRIDDFSVLVAGGDGLVRCVQVREEFEAHGSASFSPSPSPLEDPSSSVWDGNDSDFTLDGLASPLAEQSTPVRDTSREEERRVVLPPPAEPHNCTGGTKKRQKDKDSREVAETRVRYGLPRSAVFEFELLFRHLISFKSVSGDVSCLEECWKNAKFIQKLLEQLGARVKLFAHPSGTDTPRAQQAMPATRECAGSEGRVQFEDCHRQRATHPGAKSPLVVGRLGDDPAKPTVVFYGHYDVVSASMAPQTSTDSGDAWRTPPFELTGQDGYWYGRGTTDNKGPILASIFAVKALQSQRPKGRSRTGCTGSSNVRNGLEAPPNSRQWSERSRSAVQGATALSELPVNFVWIIEGEEENGSVGFESMVACAQREGWFEGCEYLICSNSYWIDDHTPCLVYGMRGVIDYQIEVRGGDADLHSGLHGGIVAEPLQDLIALVSTLNDEQGNPNPAIIPPLPGVALPTCCADGTPLLKQPPCRHRHFSREESSLLGSYFNVDRYRRQIKGAALKSQSPLDILYQRWCAPCISVSDIFTSLARKHHYHHYAPTSPTDYAALPTASHITNSNPRDASTTAQGLLAAALNEANEAPAADATSGTGGDETRASLLPQPSRDDGSVREGGGRPGGVGSSASRGSGGSHLTKGTFRVIPCSAVCNLSIRFVPDQDANALVDRLTEHLTREFGRRASLNSLKLRVVSVGDAWIARTDTHDSNNSSSSSSRQGKLFRCATRAVTDSWGVRPLVIREGGTMPVIHCLSAVLGIPAIQLPMGQSSDAAHLPNERIRMKNLYKGVEMLQRMLGYLAEDSTGAPSTHLTVPHAAP
ncbi:unnamed protein product [Vitrella brassicaformis CCMP3155]|uniref:Glutamine amidotransferase type-2 domain-containing protein n=2 Tax=Vitrella brassicaformis TaxID=1169539 RepID=A0A0G4GAN8_VITBC|nr:unnamed protein product [Vitrella brassicaformis CCMP3155]|eukprot:CEM25860.1 unnamed protein product [Vitrella brassicaformis CCMP3155]